MNGIYIQTHTDLDICSLGKILFALLYSVLGQSKRNKVRSSPSTITLLHTVKLTENSLILL